MFCLGRYYYDNPEIIELLKKILINEALKVLNNDVSLSEQKSVYSIEGSRLAVFGG